MSFKPSSRSLFAILYSVLLLIVISIILWISDLSLSVWERLEQQSDWFFWGYITALLVFISLSLLLIWRLLPKTPTKSKPIVDGKITKDISAETLTQRLDRIDNKEVDTSHIKDELNNLFSEQNSSQISLVLFGDISSGKSSLINVLLPEAEVQTSVVGGTTRAVNRYLWQTPIGDSLLLVDIPGFDEQHRELDEIAQKAVYQSHIALFLCDADITATQYQRIEEIALLEKPLVVVLNKIDRYSKHDLQLLSQAISHKLDTLLTQHNSEQSDTDSDSVIDKEIKFITVQTGGQREVTLVYPDGSEKTELRELKPDLSNLYLAIKEIIKSTSLSELELVRQQAVMNLLASDLDKVEVEARQKKAEVIVQAATKKAVVASLATITPGTDLLVQGYLGINMVKDLCRLYDVPAKDMDIEKLIKMIQADTIGAFPLLLAISGNGFKAFPGIGTVAGGLMHAVAYGLIFDSMGKAVSMTLAAQGDLSPLLIDSLYKERLVEDVKLFAENAQQSDDITLLAVKNVAKNNSH